MIAADWPDRKSTRLLTVDASGSVRDVTRAELASLFTPGDLVVANDAATLPGSLCGTHHASGEPIEIRLAAWVAAGDNTAVDPRSHPGAAAQTIFERPPAPRIPIRRSSVFGPISTARYF